MLLIWNVYTPITMYVSIVPSLYFKLIVGKDFILNLPFPSRIWNLEPSRIVELKSV